MNNCRNLRMRVLSYIMLLLCTQFFGIGITLAQLNGTYTIGSSGPNNFASFGAAVSALTLNGVNGAVTFNISPGTYNEQISISSVSGTSVSNTVTFKSSNGDSSSVILSFASATNINNNYVFELNGADYVIIKQITLQRTGTNNYSQVINISNSSTYNKFYNNRIIGSQVTTSSTYKSLVYSNNGIMSSNNVFTGNRFENGSYGVYCIGQGSNNLDSGTEVKSNHFVNQYYCGVYLAYQDSPEINFNVFDSASCSSTYRAIYCFYCNNGLRIEKNKVNANKGYGLYIHNSNGLNSKGLIANNFIKVGGSGTAVGIYLNYSLQQHIYYNNIHITGTQVVNGKAIFINGTISSNMAFLNNNLINSGGGYTYYVDVSTIAPISTSNNNNLYTTGTNLAYWRNSGNQSNLSSWQTTTTFDAQSISNDPLYVSLSNLHVRSGYLNGTGTGSLSSLTMINDDIDGELRHNTKPDIGADEFFIEDVGISGILTKPQYCFQDLDTVQIYILNNDSFPYQGVIPVFYQFGNNTPVNEITPNLTLNGGDSILFIFDSLLTYNAGGTQQLVAGTRLSIDVDKTNDTLFGYTVYVEALPQPNFGPDITICLGDSTLLSAGTWYSYLWSTNDTSSQLSVKPVISTIYSITVTSPLSCVGSDTVEVVVIDPPKPVANFTYTVLTSGLEVQFNNQSVDATAYLWDFADGTIDTVPNPLHNFPNDGSYSVTLYAKNDCKGDTTVSSISVIGIEEIIAQERIKIYPNPSDGELFIDISKTREKIDEIQVLNPYGQLVFCEKFSSNTSGTSMNINLSGLSGGIYTLLIKTSKLIINSKFVLK